MLKYTDTLVSFSEIPDEISLCINISGCTNACKNCHSPWLAEDIGKVLKYNTLIDLINRNKGITCASLMGGDSEPEMIAILAFRIKREFPDLKVAWYSGKQELPEGFIRVIKYFDFIKLGPYIEELGPLTSSTTNQVMYKVVDEQLIDITYKFWRNVT